MTRWSLVLLSIALAGGPALAGRAPIVVSGWGGCAVTAAGTLGCWGDLGKGGQPSAAKVKAVAMDGQSVCAAHGDGVSCWTGSGAKPLPALGTGATVSMMHGLVCSVGGDAVARCADRGPSAKTAVSLAPTGASDVLLTSERICVAQRTGSVYCAQLSEVTLDVLSAARLERVKGPKHAVELAGDGATVCARTGGGALWCWGDRVMGKRGPTLAKPRTINGLPGSVDSLHVHNDAFHAVAGGRVFRFGGGPGEGPVVRMPPTALEFVGADQVAAAATGRTACALSKGGVVGCWGERTRAMGTDVDPNAAPRWIAGLDDAVDLSLGRQHACVVRKGGTVACWGLNNSGQCGGGAGGPVLSPTTVARLSGATSVSAGEGHTCAMLSDGTARCWGANALGQVMPAKRRSPVLARSVVAKPTQLPRKARPKGKLAGVSAGGWNTCAVTAAGRVWCWGGNKRGALGIKQTSKRSRFGTFGEVVGLKGATSVAMGRREACVIDAKRGVLCWGLSKSSILPDGPPRSAVGPTPIAGLSDVARLDVAINKACAILTSGELRCWGHNSSGQLGMGHGKPVKSPTPVSGLGAVADVAMGLQHTCAVQSDGTVWCWGDNHTGQAGQRSGREVLAPTAVPAISDARQVGASRYGTCVRTAGGKVACWGTLPFGGVHRFKP